jgi:hypothetical protein
VRAAVEDDAAVGADEVREAGRLTALVTEAAVERRPEPLAAAFGVEHPRFRKERRAVAHVPLVAAGELGDPFALVVLVQAYDRPLHRRSSYPETFAPYTLSSTNPGDEMTRSIAWEQVASADVVRAIEEYDRLGPERFFSEHGFAPTTTYDLVWEKRRYPPKAILGTAYELATRERLASADFEGGKSGAVKVLEKLGFTIEPR